MYKDLFPVDRLFTLSTFYFPARSEHLRQKNEHAGLYAPPCLLLRQLGHAAAQAPAELTIRALFESRGAPSAEGQGHVEAPCEVEQPSPTDTRTRLRTFPHTGLKIGIGARQGSDCTW